MALSKKSIAKKATAKKATAKKATAKKAPAKKAKATDVPVANQTVPVVVVSSIAGAGYSLKPGDRVDMNVAEAARYHAKGIVKAEDKALALHLEDIAAGKLEPN